ncbi:MAG: hypothetical protein GY940_21780 [bacterium]|nr:hypothetical protein [bacterium]
MDIFVNDNKIDYKPLFPLTWSNFFQKLLQNNDWIPGDHGIVGILVDGSDSLMVMTEKPDSLVPQSIAKVEIATKNSLDITRDGFSKAVNLIESIKTEIISAADLYREGKIQDASTKIVKIMEAIKPMINFVNSVGISFSLDFDEILFNPATNTSLREKIESFLTTLQEVVTAQQKKDYVEMADYLEYQLVEDMSDWDTIINLLLREVEASSAKSS